MGRRSRQFKYAELPVFAYQTFDREPVTYSERPVIAYDKINFSDRHADSSDQPEEEAAPPELEILELDPPSKDEALDDQPDQNGKASSTRQDISN